MLFKPRQKDWIDTGWLLQRVGLDWMQGDTAMGAGVEYFKSGALFIAHQLAAFMVMFGVMWMAVRFFRLNPDNLYYFPAIFFVYFGVSLFVTIIRRRGRLERESGT